MSDTTPKLSIIIVNWNSCAYLRKCLEAIYRQRLDFSFEVVVIDSASFDGSQSMVQNRFPQAKFIQSKINLGFAKANNQAFEESTGEYVLLLNPDTELQGEALIELCRQYALLPKPGILGAKLLNTDGTVQTSCIQSFPTICNQLLSCDFLRGKFPKAKLWGMAALYYGDEKPQPVEAISGACMLMHRNRFIEVRGFSEDYFMYAEDIDLSNKVRQLGFTNYLVPSSVIIHHGGGSSSLVASEFSSVMMREATWRYMRKWRGATGAFLYRAVVAISGCFRLPCLLVAILVRSGNRERVRKQWKKWVAILRWSLNCDSTVRKFYSPS